jgi:hypothetical protein
VGTSSLTQAQIALLSNLIQRNAFLREESELIRSKEHWVWQDCTLALRIRYGSMQTKAYIHPIKHCTLSHRKHIQHERVKHYILNCEYSPARTGELVLALHCLIFETEHYNFAK